jgi:hypothetical protein
MAKKIKMKSFNLNKNIKVTNLTRESEGKNKGYYYEGKITTEKNGKYKSKDIKFLGINLKYLKMYLKQYQT